MGYYTKFDLEFEEFREVTEEAVFNALKEINPDLFYGTEETLEDLFCEEMKWYDHEKDMIEVSKRFPDTMFELYGEGEDHEDIWKEYFKNGKCFLAPAIITYDNPPIWMF